MKGQRKYSRCKIVFQIKLIYTQFQHWNNWMLLLLDPTLHQISGLMTFTPLTSIIDTRMFLYTLHLFMQLSGLFLQLLPWKLANHLLFIFRTIAQTTFLQNLSSCWDMLNSRQILLIIQCEPVTTITSQPLKYDWFLSSGCPQHLWVTRV